MKTIKNLNDFVDLINIIYSNEQELNNEFIQTNGLAKFKSNVYEVLQYIDKDLSTDALSPANKNLFNALLNLNTEEREKLSFSMLTSYYTPNDIIKPVQNIVNDYFKKNNFDTLSICEPSAGAGNFIHDLVSDKNYIDAVEIDNFTAKVLKNNINHPNVKIHNIGYENFKTDRKYDLVIGNIPFGNFSIYDESLSREKINIVNGQIHNYFFLKSVENLKPGGILALMTTASMNNSSNGKLIREYLMKETNLISCVRFNDTTFKESNTKVISDLLILQKPLYQKLQITPREQKYINTIPSILKDDTNVNEYVSENPANMMGEYYVTKGYAGRDIVSVTANDFDYSIILPITLQNDFDTFSIKNLNYQNLEKKDTIEEQAKKTALYQKENAEIINSYPHVVLGNVVEFNNEFFKVVLNPEASSLYTKIPMTIQPLDKENLSLLIQIREGFKNLTLARRQNNPDQKEIAKIHANFENNYDLFNFKCDAINTKRNCKLLSYEVESDLLRGLETFVNNQYQKSAVFNIEYFKEEIKQEQASSIDNAIALSYSKYATINLDYITSVYNKNQDEWVTEALQKKLLYINPVLNNVTSIQRFELCIPSKFQSGYIEGKLDIYNDQKLLLNSQNNFRHLVTTEIIKSANDALIAVMPFKLTIKEIEPALGETWIPLEYFELFGKQHLNCDTFSLKHIETLDKYTLKSNFSPFAHENYSVRNENRNVSFDKIFEMAMIHNIPEYTIATFKNGKEIRQVDKQTINSVLYNIKKLNDNFTLWLEQNPSIAKDLENKYHLMNNAIVKENFNIDLLNFDELKGKTPYSHQKAAVWQNITQMGGIIDHEVGFGKTLTMAMTTMKKIELNLIKKELIVGKNANYKELYNDYKEAFPKGKFLLVQEQDVSVSKKQETFYRIMNNNYDAVFIAHSSLIAFPPAPVQEEAVLRETIKDLSDTLLINKEDKLLTSGEVNKMQKALADCEIKLQYAQDIINSKKADGILTFDDLKFDSITVDESHDFKNLKFVTKHTRVAGLGNGAAVQKTDNLLNYIRNIQTKNGGDKGVTFASGTTISNSITEMYLLFKYLIPTTLANKKINNFDQWARMFARKTNEYEESVSGQVKQKERFRYFVKVPELAKIYNDITNFADFNTFKIERPLGVTQLIAIEPYKEQKQYMERVKQFGQTKNLAYLHNYKGDSEKAGKAVGLICTSEGKKAALSLKLIDPNFPDHPSDKINTMTNVFVENYHKFSSDKGAQLIFCDQGVPNGTNFNLYAYMKELLVNKGIPENQIAFIHDWDKKRTQLFNKVNTGEIRCVIGSTGKMGVGVNMQKRITALHHLDFPWRPTDIIQRNGRAERTGNIVLPKYDNKLDIYCYATKESLDAYTFNLLQIKHNFIMQIKNASVKTRTVDEGMIDQKGNLNFSEYMAACSSNQYLTQRLAIEKKLNLAIDNKIVVEQQKRQLERRLNQVIPSIEKYEKIITKLHSDIMLSKVLVSFTDPAIAISLRSKLEYAITNNIFSAPFYPLKNGFNFIVEKKYKDLPISMDNYQVFLKTPNAIKIGYKSQTFTKNDTEVMEYLQNCILRLPTILDNSKKSLSDDIYQKGIIEKSIESCVYKEDVIINLKKEIAAIDVLIEKENSCVEEKEEKKKEKEQEKEEEEPRIKKERGMKI